MMAEVAEIFLREIYIERLLACTHTHKKRIVIVDLICIYIYSLNN